MDLCPRPHVTLSRSREKLGLYILLCEKGEMASEFFVKIYTGAKNLR